MRVSVASVILVAALVSAGVSYATAAAGGKRTASCSHVRVTGGNFNGLTGGTIVAGVGVRNDGATDCTINTRPWVSLGPIAHAVSVQDATSQMFGRFGAPEQALTLRRGQHVVAQIFISPGSCNQARSAVFELRAHAGWAEHGVPVSNLVCRNGSGTVWIGSFQR